ncbi:hypothetical protein HZA43_00870 [Candidatus Peregrinibacteria bacterium]|nr:hypothetical protein [Candidatus Peregrinibacteria bacterium]
MVGVGAFYGGAKYGSSTATATASAATRNFQGFNRGGAGGANNSAMFAGTILSKDDTSITLQLRDGGSRIIFVSATTPVEKTTAGTTKDLTLGQTVSVRGQTNSDGSVTAQTIQLKPAMPTKDAPGQKDATTK